MAQTLKLKRSAVSGNTPTTSDLALGEIAINTYDGNIFIKKNDGTEAIVTFEPGGTGNAGTIEEDNFTGNGSTTAFTLSSAPSSEENLLVFVEAAFQNRDSFTISGTTITFDDAPDTGTSVRVFHVIPGSLDDGILTVAKFAASAIVTEAEGISSNDNDTTLPTSAAVKDYVDSQVATADTLSEVLANGNTTGGTNIAFGDNDKAVFGAGSDLEIYHDGSSDIIKNTTGNQIYMQSTGFNLSNSSGLKHIYANNDYGVTLFYQDNGKLETVSGGIDVTGNISVSGTVDGVDIAARNSVLTSTTTTANAALPKTGGAMTGAITTNSTFDGRDVATDGTKLDTIETSATADQTQAEINALGITATGLSGTPNVSVGTISSGNITTTGYLRGPSTFTIDPATHGDDTGTLVIAGNLQVDGTTTTINSTTVAIDDLNFSIASDAADSAAANGAGITIGGASATMLYTHATTSFDFNKPLNVTGLTTTGNINLGDNDKAVFGAGSDLQIYHSGTHSYIVEQGTGDLRIYADNEIRLGSWTTGELYFDGTADGSARLYNNGSAKLATTSTGIDVTGTVTADGIVHTGDTDTYIKFLSNRIYSDVGGNRLLDLQPATSELNSTGSVEFNTGASLLKRLNIANNGDISFYEDTGTTAKLFWDASAERLGIGISSPARQFHLHDASGDNNLHITNNTTGATASDGFSIVSQSGTNSVILNQRESSNLIFHTNNTEAMRIDSVGRVGIGTSSPTRTLDVTKSVGSILANFKNTGGTTSFITLGNTTSTADQIRVGSNGTALILSTNYAERMRIDASGNVGIGVTPESWYTGGSMRALQVGGTTAVMSLFDTRSIFANNYYLKAGTGADTYINTDEATQYYQEAGKHIWKYAPSGTADTTITWSEAMRIDASGRLGIGTASPTHKLHVSGSNSAARFTDDGTGYSLDIEHDTANGITTLEQTNSGGDLRLKAGVNSGLLIFDTNNTESMRIDSVGRVGIGTASPSCLLHVSGGGTTTAASIGIPSIAQLNIGNAGNSINYYDADTQIFRNGVGSQRMRLDSSGNLLVGTTSVSNSGKVTIDAGASGTGLYAVTDATSGYAASVFERSASDGDITVFKKGGTAVGSIQSRAGVVSTIVLDPRSGQGAGLTGAGAGSDTARQITPTNESGVEVDGKVSLGNVTNGFRNLYLSGGLRGDITFKNNAGTNEYARFDSSGNLLVGNTSATGRTDASSGEGIALSAGSYGGFIGATRSGANPLALNRLSSDGSIATFAKDGTTVGSIGVISSDNLFITGGVANHSGLALSQHSVLPMNGSSYSDGTVDLGSSGVRFKDLHLSGTARTNQLRLENSGSTTSGLFHEKDVTGSGTSTNLSVFAETGREINFMTNGSVTKAMTIDSSGNVGIGTASPTSLLHLHGTYPKITLNDSTGVNRAFSVGTNNETFTIRNETSSSDALTISNTNLVGIGTTSPTKQLTISGADAEFLLSRTGSYADTINMGMPSGVPTIVGGTDLAFGGSGAWTEHMRIKSDGNVGIGTTSPDAKLQVEEYGIDTTSTSTSATTQVAVHSFAAADFRSARFTIQVTNSTDSTYHITEIILIHDGTTANITEYGTIFTGSAEATFDADISSGNVRLLATPASTDTMAFKVVCHSITT